MEKDISALLNSEQSKKLSGKKDDIERLAASRDGVQVTKMAANDPELQSAIKSGDMEAMSRRLKAILQTDEGARVFRRISDMLK
jgi:hypothetical protein